MSPRVIEHNAPRRSVWALILMVACLASTLGHRSAVAITLLANPDSYSVRHDRTLTVAAPGVLANDVGILDSSTAVRDSGPSHGSLTLRPNGGLTYTPAAGYVGQDSFQYHAQGGLVDIVSSNVTTVTITVTNALPVVRDDDYAATTGVTKFVPAPGVLGNDMDADDDVLIAELVDGGGSGSIDLTADGSFTFTSGGSFVGDRTFTYRAWDGAAWSNAATVTISVSAAPAPTATPTPGATALPTPTGAPTPSPGTPAPTPTGGAGATAGPIDSTGPSVTPLPGASAATGPSASPADGSTPGAGATGAAPGGGPGQGAGDDPDGITLGGDAGQPRGLGAIGGIAAALSLLRELPGGLLGWSYPALVMTVPGLLLLLAVGAQAIGALAWLPLVRRRLGGFGVLRRR